MQAKIQQEDENRRKARSAFPLPQGHCSYEAKRNVSKQESYRYCAQKPSDQASDRSSDKGNPSDQQCNSQYGQHVVTGYQRLKLPFESRHSFALYAMESESCPPFDRIG